MSDPIATAISTNAQQPRRVKGDEGEVEQQPIQDQIKADQYIAGKTAMSQPSRGLRFSKLVPPGCIR